MLQGLNGAILRIRPLAEHEGGVRRRRPGARRFHTDRASGAGAEQDEPGQSPGRGAMGRSNESGIRHGQGTDLWE